MKKRKYSSLSEINVTNLVDVTMVLLIIFMITAPLLRSGMQVDLPRSDNRDTTPREGILVSLNKEGIIFIDEEQVKPENFSAKLLKVYTSRNKQQVLLQADRAVAYGKVVALMDDVKSIGIHNLGLIVEPKEQK
jgi:biopolymer transport protein TolR